MDTYLWLLAIGSLAVLAILPTIIAILRGADGIFEIFVLDVLCSLTIFAWPITLYYAIIWPRKPRPYNDHPVRLPDPPAGHARHGGAPPLI